MKRTILTLFILLSALPLWAEWEFIGSSGNDSASFYMDFDRIREKNGYVYYWVLTDHLIGKNKYGALSSVLYHQGDCSDFRARTLSAATYSEQMGNGDVIASYDNMWNWIYAKPNSVDEALLEKACKHIGK